MANRHILSTTRLEEFKTYLLSNGYTLNAPKGSYEVLRASKPGRKHPLIVYERLSNNAGTELVHLTVMDRDMNVIRNFLHSKKGNTK